MTTNGTKGKEKEIKFIHNIVYSTKGGCGKTTLAWWLWLSNKRKELNGNSKYFVDMDFLGTATAYLFEKTDDDMLFIHDYLFNEKPLFRVLDKTNIEKNRYGLRQGGFYRKNETLQLCQNNTNK